MGHQLSSHPTLEFCDINLDSTPCLQSQREKMAKPSEKEQDKKNHTVIILHDSTCITPHGTHATTPCYSCYCTRVVSLQCTILHLPHCAMLECCLASV